MFNGIIYNTGKVDYLRKLNNNVILSIKTNLKFTKKEIGDSVACNGVCLTVTKIENKSIVFFISNETLLKSNFKFLKKNQTINLEKSLKYGEKISGSFSQGHVDTTATVKKIKIIGESWILKLKINNNKLKKFLVEKASISINGVSLTIAKVLNDNFEISIIPHTLKLTNLKNLKNKDLVNIELDIFSKYINKFSN